MSGPDVDRVLEPNSKNVALRPVEQIQVKVVLEHGRVKHLKGQLVDSSVLQLQSVVLLLECRVVLGAQVDQLVRLVLFESRHNLVALQVLEQRLLVLQDLATGLLRGLSSSCDVRHDRVGLKRHLAQVLGWRSLSAEALFLKQPSVCLSLLFLDLGRGLRVTAGLIRAVRALLA